MVWGGRELCGGGGGVAPHHRAKTIFALRGLRGSCPKEARAARVAEESPLPHLCAEEPRPVGWAEDAPALSARPHVLPEMGSSRVEMQATACAVGLNKEPGPVCDLQGGSTAKARFGATQTGVGLWCWGWVAIAVGGVLWEGMRRREMAATAQEEHGGFDRGRASQPATIVLVK